jgi:hypothetical protein
MLGRTIVNGLVVLTGAVVFATTMLIIVIAHAKSVYWLGTVPIHIFGVTL